MFEALTYKTLAPLILRLGLAVIFIFHGLQKVNADTNWGTAWGGEMPTAMQVAVAYGELVGGIALFFGFLTRLAALGIAVIMGGAIALVHGQHGFNLRVPDDPNAMGFEYNFALIVMCLALIVAGGGILSLDWLLFRRRKRD